MEQKGSLRRAFFVSSMGYRAERGAMVIEKIAGFMGGLLDEIRTRHAEQRREHIDMARTATSILALVAAQGQQIEQLLAQRAEAEQADLETIGSALDANTAKMAAALLPPSGGSDAAKVAVAAASTAPTTTVVVTGNAAVPVGAGLSGPGLAAGTTATDVSTTAAVDGSTVSTITLSQPTVADHAGDQTEQLAVTPAAAQ